MILPKFDRLKIVFSLLPLLLIGGCISENTQQEIKQDIQNIGNVRINYYSNKTVTSLKIPPDLTSPNQENAFKIDEYVKDLREDYISFSDNQNTAQNENFLIKNKPNLSVKKSGSRRWLIIDKSFDDVWDLSRAFIKEQGFAIQSTNRKTGIIDTDYLENKPILPDQSVGFIRSMIRKATGQSYALPVIDKYRIRLEPVDPNKTEIHLSLTSFHEVIYNQGKGIEEGENTIWQPIEKDINIETEMLYRFMVYLGGESAKSIEKIKQAQNANQISVALQDSINGYAKLIFEESFLDSWDSLSWALDQKNINIDDKDIKEKTIYIVSTRTNEPGFFEKLLDEVTLQKKYQLQFKVISSEVTEVYFNDISEENNQEAKDYSYELFKSLKSVF